MEHICFKGNFKRIKEIEYNLDRVSNLDTFSDRIDVIPVFKNNTLFSCYKEKELFAYDIINKKFVWKSQTKYRLHDLMLCNDYLITTDYINLFIFESTSGKRIQIIEETYVDLESAILVNNNLLLPNFKNQECKFLVLDLENLKLRPEIIFEGWPSFFLSYENILYLNNENNGIESLSLPHYHDSAQFQKNWGYKNEKNKFFNNYPFITEDILIASIFPDNLIGLSIKSGKIIWSRKLGTLINCQFSELINNNSLNVLSYNSLFKIDVFTGKILDIISLEKFDFITKGIYTVDQYSQNNYLIYSRKSNLIYNYNNSTRTIIQKFELNGNLKSPPIYYNESFFINDCESNFYVLT